MIHPLVNASNVKQRQCPIHTLGCDWAKLVDPYITTYPKIREGKNCLAGESKQLEAPKCRSVGAEVQPQPQPQNRNHNHNHKTKTKTTTTKPHGQPQRQRQPQPPLQPQPKEIACCCVLRPNCLHCVRTMWALRAHCVHTAHAEAGILTQEYLSPDWLHCEAAKPT